MGVEIKPTAISDVIEFLRQIFGDERGFFFEAFRSSWLTELGVDVQFVQQNESFSQNGVLRGLHFQLNRPQGKLVRALSGDVYDVAVDVREGSNTFGDWVGVTLRSDLKNSLWVPAGFAHGFLVLSETAELVYQCTEYYDPESEYSIHWQDCHLGIEWPLPESDIKVSRKDSSGSSFSNAPKFHHL